MWFKLHVWHQEALFMVHFIHYNVPLSETAKGK